MQTIIPKTSMALSSLLRADFTTQWRNRRAVVLTLIVPVIILISWKGMIPMVGGPFVLSNSITIGLFATGIMGYANSVARDRDKGIFQRLRVAPITPWTIMLSRLLVQMTMFLVITTAVFIIGKQVDNITLTPTAYLLTYCISILSGAVALSLGQMIVGFIKNPETVNSTTRLVYLALIMAGMFGEIESKLGKLSDFLNKLVQWSPYGSIKTTLAASMEPSKWDTITTQALLITIVYIVLFTTLGIRWFKWNTK